MASTHRRQSLITIRGRGRRFDYRRYLQFLEQLQKGEEVGCDHYIFDLTEPAGFAVEAMVPFVCTTHALASRGRRVQVLPPDAGDEFERQGWLAGIRGEIFASTDSSTHFALAMYRTHEELNSLATRAIKYLTRDEDTARGVRAAFEWSLNEVADNVLNHASSDLPGWIQVESVRGAAVVVVADAGRGIRGSLAEAYDGLRSDPQAIALAVQRGVTRSRDAGQGNGLSSLLSIAVNAKADLIVHSGTGLLRVSEGIVQSPEDAGRHPGTAIVFRLPTRAPIDVDEAIWGPRSWPSWDSDYVTDEEINFRLGAEESNFGNRYTARRLRTQLVNLMNEHPDHKVAIDFAGIDLVTSSFADEFVAMLVQHLGVVEFISRCKFLNMSRFVANTVNQVVSQRMSPPDR